MRRGLLLALLVAAALPAPAAAESVSVSMPGKYFEPAPGRIVYAGLTVAAGR